MKGQLDLSNLSSDAVKANTLETGTNPENLLEEIVDLETVIILNNRAVSKNPMTPDITR